VAKQRRFCFGPGPPPFSSIKGSYKRRFRSSREIGFVSQKRRGRLSALRLCRPSKAHTWSATVFVDELHASFLEGAFYYLKSRPTWLAPLLFEMVDRHDGNTRSISQVLLAPT